MNTNDLEEELTADERRRARPFAIEALRSLGIALSEDERDAWLETLVCAVVRGARAQSVLDLEHEARATLDRRTAVKPGLRPARPQWIDIPFKSGDTITAEGAEELRLFALALEQERSSYLADGCTAVTKAWCEANEKRIANLTADADALRLEVARLRSALPDGSEQDRVPGPRFRNLRSGFHAPPNAKLRPVFVHLVDTPIRDVIAAGIQIGAGADMLAQQVLLECLRQIADFNQEGEEVPQPHVAIRLPEPIPEPDEDTCVSSAEEIEDHGYNEALEDVRSKLAEQGFQVAP